MCLFQISRLSSVRSQWRKQGLTRYFSFGPAACGFGNRASSIFKACEVL